MISVSTYIFLSFLVLILFVLDYAYAYREFFTTVVELTYSPTFRLVCINSFVAATIVLWRFSRKLFFGSLNPEETEVVSRKLPFYVMECLVVPFYFESTIFNRVGVVSLLTVVSGALHRVAQERVTTLHITENRALRIRMLWGLALFCMAAVPLDLYVVLDVLVNSSWRYEKQIGLYYCIALLYAQFAISSVRCIVRVLFSEVIGVTNHGGLAFYVESLFSLSKSILIFLGFAYVSTVAEVPIPLIRLLVHHVLNFCNKLGRLIRYLSLMRLLRSISNATPEDIARDPRCSICHDDMTPTQECKRLPCMHCYHLSCLRPWFEKMSTCPCCRTDLLHPLTKTTRAANTVATPQPREGHAGVNPQVDPAQGEWQTLNDVEVRQAFERYLEAFGVRQQCGEVNSAPVEQEQQQQQQRQRHEQRFCIPGIESHPTLVVGRGGTAVLGTAARVTPPAFVRGERGTTSVRTGGNQVAQQLGPWDLQRLEAYKSYEEAVRTATEELHRQLQAIDSAMNDDNAAT